MKKIAFLATALVIISVSACTKDAGIAPVKSINKKVISSDPPPPPPKNIPALDGNPAL